MWRHPYFYVHYLGLSPFPQLPGLSMGVLYGVLRDRPEVGDLKSVLAN